MVVLQMALIPAGALASGAVMYTGLRQHLYAVPGIAVMAGLGAHALYKWGSARRANWVRSGVAVVLFFALAAPLVEQTHLVPLQLHVRQCRSRNRWRQRSMGDGLLLDERAGDDREGPSRRRRRLFGFLDPEWLPVPSVAWTGCSHRVFLPVQDRRGTDVKPYAVVDGELWVMARSRAGGAVPDYCVPVDNVTRRMRTEQVVMAYVLRCDAGRVRGN